MTNDKLDSHHFQLESTGTAKVGGKELPKRANPILLLRETYHCPKSRFLVSEPKFLLLHFIGKGSTPSPPPKHKWHHGTNITDNYSKTFIFIRKPILPFKIVLLAITTNKERPVCNQLQWKKFITHCTLLMRRFWGLRSLWSTLQLWQKARPLSNWYINDYGENKLLENYSIMYYITSRIYL